MPAIHAARRERLAARLPARDAEAVVVCRLVDVRYLTGFTGSNSALLLHADGAATIATDGRYQDQVAEQCPDLPALITRSLVPDLLAGSGLGRVAFQADAVTVAEFDEWRALGPGYVRLGDALRELRQVKDDTEIAALRRACTISDEALAAVLPQVRTGRTEREIARELDATMLDLGAEAVSFETIVATGENSAIPHHEPTQRPVAAGDFLKIDFGALVDGYHADMTRTFCVGAAAEPWQQEVYLAVAAAQQAGVDALGPGRSAAEVDEAARSVLREAGLAEHFTHGLGHGVGLEIHEAPFLGATSADRLASGVPVTVEPGVYLPGRGGVRIEDTLVVRHGRPESLTTTTCELLVLG